MVLNEWVLAAGLASFILFLFCVLFIWFQVYSACREAPRLKLKT